MTIDPRLHRIVAAHPYPLLFATISGAHLYGFPSPDSDFDLRGAHVLPRLRWEELVDEREDTARRRFRLQLRDPFLEIRDPLFELGLRRHLA